MLCILAPLDFTQRSVWRRHRATGRPAMEESAYRSTLQLMKQWSSRASYLNNGHLGGRVGFGEGTFGENMFFFAMIFGFLSELQRKNMKFAGFRKNVSHESELQDGDEGSLTWQILSRLGICPLEIMEFMGTSRTASGGFMWFHVMFQDVSYENHVDIR